MPQTRLVPFKTLNMDQNSKFLHNFNLYISDICILMPQISIAISSFSLQQNLWYLVISTINTSRYLGYQHVHNKIHSYQPHTSQKKPFWRTDTRTHMTIPRLTDLPYAFPIIVVSWNPIAIARVRIMRIQFISGI